MEVFPFAVHRFRRAIQTKSRALLPPVAVVVVVVVMALVVVVMVAITILIAGDNVRDTAIDRAVGRTRDRTESLPSHLARKGSGGHLVGDFHHTVRIRAGVAGGAIGRSRGPQCHRAVLVDQAGEVAQTNRRDVGVLAIEAHEVGVDLADQATGQCVGQRPGSVAAEDPLLQARMRCIGAVARALVGHVQRMVVGEEHGEGREVTAARAVSQRCPGGVGRETVEDDDRLLPGIGDGRQHIAGRGAAVGCRHETRRRLRRIDDGIDRLHAVAAAALGEVQRAVELSDAAEVVVLAGLVVGALLAESELQQGIDLRRITARDGHAGRPAVDLSDRLEARSLGHIGGRAVAGGTKRRGIAVVGVAHRVVQAVRAQQGRAAVVAAVVDRRRVRELPVIFQGDDGAVEGIVTAEGEAHGIGRVLTCHGIGVRDVEGADAWAGIADEHQVVAMFVPAEVQRQLRFRGEAGHDLTGWHAQAIEHAAAVWVDSRQEDGRGHAEAGVDRVVVPDSDVVVVGDRRNGCGVRIGQRRADHQGRHCPNPAFVVAAADDQRTGLQEGVIGRGDTDRHESGGAAAYQQRNGAGDRRTNVHGNPLLVGLESSELLSDAK
jgi:hypothetical protein